MHETIAAAIEFETEALAHVSLPETETFKVTSVKRQTKSST